jgi:hypothetical protein
LPTALSFHLFTLPRAFFTSLYFPFSTLV